MKLRATAAAFLFGAVALTGCGGGTKLYTVEGTVTVDGQPLEGAMVTFQADTRIATGITTASGKFRLLTAGQEGCPAGTYQVWVTKVPPVTEPTGGSTGGNSTEMYQKMMKERGATAKGGTINIPKPKSEVPDRYSKPGGLPNQIVPATSAIVIEMKSK